MQSLNFWSAYKESDGKEWITYFENHLQGRITAASSLKLIELYRKRTGNIRNALVLADTLERVQDFYETPGLFLESIDYSIDSVFDSVYEDGMAGMGERHFQSYLLEESFFLTTLLSYELPELIIPLYYRLSDRLFLKILDLLAIPRPNDQVFVSPREYLNYLKELNSYFLLIRTEYGMSTAEFLAFLYDYAPRMLHLGERMYWWVFEKKLNILSV